MKIEFDTKNISMVTWEKYVRPLSRIALVAFLVGSFVSSCQHGWYFWGGFYGVSSLGAAIWAIATTVSEADEKLRRSR